MQYAVPSLIALILSQILKCVFDSIVSQKFSIRMLSSSGGMPSSHSAICASLATYLAFTEGFQSPLFGCSLVLSIIVMYDAIGVRQETGKQSKVLNELMEILEQNGHPLSFTDRLNTLTGHTGLQVVAGAMLGMSIGIGCVALPMLLSGSSVTEVLAYILHHFLLRN